VARKFEMLTPTTSSALRQTLVGSPPAEDGHRLRAFAQGVLCLQQVPHLEQFVIVDAVTHAAVDALFDVTTQAAQHLR
jgi:hypothetical protein